MTESTAQCTCPGDFTAAEVEVLVCAAWSLQDYLAWLGRRDRQHVLDGWWVGSLTRDAEHWAEAGVASAADLWWYLEREAAKERRKEAMAGWDDEDPLVGRGDRCMHCGDLADFTATGGQLCVPCDRDEDPYYQQLRDEEPDPAGDEEDELPAWLSSAMDVRFCANKLSRLAVGTGWHAV